MEKLSIMICALLLVATACSKENSRIETYTDIELISGNWTKGTGSGNTYRIYLEGISGTVTENKSFNGSYYDKTNGEPLVPCSVDSDGAWTEDDESCGLRGSNGPYKMHIVHPAINGTEIPGESGKYGYFVERNSQDEDIIYVSGTNDVTVSGSTLAETGSQAQYIFDASEMELKQPRSKIELIFKCGNDITSTTLQRIELKNIISEGYFRPYDNKFYFDEQAKEDKEIYKNDSGGLELTTGQSKDLEINEYILSMNYGEKDEQGNTIWPMPSLEIETGSAQEQVKFTANLGWNFEPQKDYRFTITINSIYVKFEVSAIPWTTTEENIGNIDAGSSWSIDIPLTDGSTYTLLDWKKGDPMTGTI